MTEETTDGTQNQTTLRFASFLLSAINQYVENEYKGQISRDIGLDLTTGACSAAVSFAESLSDQNITKGSKVVIDGKDYFIRLGLKTKSAIQLASDTTVIGKPH